MHGMLDSRSSFSLWGASSIAEQYSNFYQKQTQAMNIQETEEKREMNIA